MCQDNYIFPKEIRVSCYRGYPSKGDPITVTTLHDVLFNKPGLHNINPNSQKGAGYAVQFYVSNVLGGTSEDTFTDGIIAIDIDKIAKEDCKTIYDNFDSICRMFNGLLCCTYSNSYYNPEKTTGGLHLIVRTDKNQITRQEYTGINIKYSAVFAYIVYKLLGIDIRPREQYGLDPALKSIAHRFFLNYSTVQWNDYASPMSIDDTEIMVVKDWFDQEYDNKKYWFEKKSDYEIVDCKFNSIDITTYNGGKVNLGFKGRINIINALHFWGISDSEILRILLNICGPNDWEGDKREPGALRRSIVQCIETSHTQTPAAHHLEHARDILSSIGIDVDIEISKVYKPIDFNFDSIFEEVWESLKNEPYHNVHYNPDNYLKLQLTNSQYLMDYKHQITEMITRYQMTYLVADCMVGKTTYALNMQNEYGLFDDDFIIHFKGDTFDLCVPYNSVADNKASSSRKDIKRVKTENIKKFSTDKRNVFIWNTIMPLYEEYFKLGIVKRMVLFIDESQKIVTDDYRWETVFEMFKVLPVMYKHFVFMTGTPAGELEYLKQYFPDYCIIKIDKEEDFKRECKILKYDKFGFGDKINLIESVINDGQLPLIYSNSKKEEWLQACKTINANRVETGLNPYNVLVYDRPNAERLYEVNSTNSIKQYDVVIATKYCSVGIDFQKDDKRMRCSIIDYAGEHECMFHDIWQFTLRNRKQDTVTKLIVNNNESYNDTLYNYWYYKKLFMDMAKVHTYKMVNPAYEDEEAKEVFSFTHDIFRIRRFGNLMKNNWFGDDKNVALLGIYFLYRKIFSNIRIIKHMLEKRGVKITEIDVDHVVAKMDCTTKREIYNFFVDKFKEIGVIRLSKGQYDKSSYQIDINSNDVEYIEDGKIYSRNMHYMDWLIKQFAGKDDWYEILKERDYITADTFAAYNRMAMIARRITKKEIDKIKRFRKVMIEDDINDMVHDLVKKHYSGVMDITDDEIRKSILLSDIINDYKKILQFSIDNIEFIEEIKNAQDEGTRLLACHKMKIAMEQKEAEMARKKMSNAGKKHSKPITVRWKNSGEIVTYDSKLELAEALGVTKQNLNSLLRSKKCAVQKI